jgi:hypothetical protein
MFDLEISKNTIDYYVSQLDQLKKSHEEISKKEIIEQTVRRFAILVIDYYTNNRTQSITLTMDNHDDSYQYRYEILEKLKKLFTDFSINEKSYVEDRMYFDIHFNWENHIGQK